jgi:hypothetical protein
MTTYYDPWSIISNDGWSIVFGYVPEMLRLLFTDACMKEDLDFGTRCALKFIPSDSNIPCTKDDFFLTDDIISYYVSHQKWISLQWILSITGRPSYFIIDYWHLNLNFMVLLDERRFLSTNDILRTFHSAIYRTLGLGTCRGENNLKYKELVNWCFDAKGIRQEDITDVDYIYLICSQTQSSWDLKWLESKGFQVPKSIANISDYFMIAAIRNNVPFLAWVYSHRLIKKIYHKDIITLRKYRAINALHFIYEQGIPIVPEVMKIIPERTKEQKRRRLN